MKRPPAGFCDRSQPEVFITSTRPGSSRERFSTRASECHALRRFDGFDQSRSSDAVAVPPAAVTAPSVRRSPRRSASIAVTARGAPNSDRHEPAAHRTLLLRRRHRVGRLQERSHDRDIRMARVPPLGAPISGRRVHGERGPTRTRRGRTRTVPCGWRAPSSTSPDDDRGNEFGLASVREASPRGSNLARGVLAPSASRSPYRVLSPGTISLSLSPTIHQPAGPPY